MTTEDVKSLRIGQFLYHDTSEKYLQITDISWRCAHSNPDGIADIAITAKDFVERCEWTIKETELENYGPAPADFDTNAYIKECEAIRHCKCCECPEEDEFMLDEKGVCDYCNEQKRTIKTSVRKSANVDLYEFDCLSSKGDFMELTEWSNGEGYDISLYRNNKDESIQFSNGELEALFNLAKAIGFKFNDLSKI